MSPISTSPSRPSPSPSGCSSCSAARDASTSANSGAEANEAAFKIGRLTGRRHMVATDGGFHGRTMGALALTGQPGKRTPFLPLPGRRHARPLRRRGSAARGRHRGHRARHHRADPGRERRGRTAQGLSAGRPGDHPRHRHPAGARRGADRHRPDRHTGSSTRRTRASSRTSSRSPRDSAADCRIGATVVFGEAAELLKPGHHGSTFGGNPVACAAGTRRPRHPGRRRTARRGEAARRETAGRDRGAGTPVGRPCPWQRPVAGYRAHRAARTTGAAGGPGCRFPGERARARCRTAHAALTIGDAEVDAFLQALPGILDDQQRGRTIRGMRRR